MSQKQESDAFQLSVRALLRPAAVAAVEPAEGELGVAVSKFGGRPYAERGDAWPTCGGCGKGLSFIFQANLAECPDEVRHAIDASTELLAFYYCQNCTPWGDSALDKPASWAVRRYVTPSAANAVAIQDVSPQEQLTIPCRVQWQTVMSLPDWGGLGEVAPSVEEESVRLDSNRPWEPYQRASDAELGSDRKTFGTQIGGYPAFVQGGAEYACPKCGMRMRLLAQIDSEFDADLMWGDGGCIYLFECPEHRDQVLMELQCT